MERHQIHVANPSLDLIWMDVQANRRKQDDDQSVLWKGTKSKYYVLLFDLVLIIPFHFASQGGDL